MRIQVYLCAGNSACKFLGTIGRIASGELVREILSVIRRQTHGMSCLSSSCRSLSNDINFASSSSLYLTSPRKSTIWRDALVDTPDFSFDVEYPICRTPPL